MDDLRADLRTIQAVTASKYSAFCAKWTALAPVLVLTLRDCPSRPCARLAAGLGVRAPHGLAGLAVAGGRIRHSQEPRAGNYVLAEGPATPDCEELDSPSPAPAF